MKLWGRKTSANVQKVVWTLGELGLDYDRVDVGGAFGGLDTPEYLAMNPTGLIPVLQDGDLTLWESNAIVRHLARSYGGGVLAGPDAGAQAQADIWMEWFQNAVHPHIYTVFWQLVRTPAATRDTAAIAAAEQALARHMAVADAQLARHPFLAGDTLSMADIPFGTLLYRYHTLDIARAPLPALAAYYARLCDRPAYQTGAMVSFDALKVPGA